MLLKIGPQTPPHLLIYVDVTGVDAIPEKVFGAAVAAAQVAAVQQLPARTHRDTNTVKDSSGKK